MRSSSTQTGKYRKDALKHDAQRILVPVHPFLIDDTQKSQMRRPLDEVDFPHRLRNFLLQEAFKPDPLQKDHLPGVPVERGTQCQTVRAQNYQVAKKKRQFIVSVNRDLPDQQRIAHEVRWCPFLLPYDRRLPRHASSRAKVAAFLYQVACFCLLGRRDAKVDHALKQRLP